MDNRAIGVFDSGLGGLTTVKKLLEVLPGEDLIYLGDTGRVPYGGRSRETLLKYAGEDIRFLLQYDIKAILVACGTVSTAVLEEIRGDYSLPITGVVEAAVRKAAAVSRNGRIGLIGTAASIRSGAYVRRLREIRPDAQILGKACPLFVPLVENRRTRPGDPVIETVAEEYLSSLREAGVDTLILGCTHYPLLREVIAGIMGPAVTLVDAGAETAKLAAVSLAEAGLLSGRTSGGRCRYFVTDSTEDFAETASLFLETDVQGEVSRVSLDAF